MKSGKRALGSVFQRSQDDRWVVRVTLPEGDPFVTLFSESAGRVLVSVTRANEARFTALCGDLGLPHTRIGVVDVLSTDLEIEGQFRIPLRDLRAARSETIRRRFET